ncbi:folate transporter 1-like isoform X1 [Folsomia candida]|uniref:folate transporter 1-like isoform X1 n=1 Tax=Folsomia candida TaxID=158441 RepID=UPI00160519F6|nr:folate transporter 1-like isoform X1 [Folsomia candida]XP_035701504.1 folate transporter 1-like isoform X1 [Folsomia candida]XP_035701505.1 folate transporter 1-like isoform X1 [Folsomia candida]
MKERCKWKAAILVLIMVGLLKEFRPSGPFLVDYAVDHKNFTGEQMTHEVLPATTGSYIVSLILLLMVTDVLCYKPIIVAGGVYNTITWVITIWGFHSINLARLRQIFYGLSVTTTEVAYFTYMYANIEKNEYKRVTSYTHSAIHFGQFVSGMTGQLLISFNLMDFEELNYLSLGGGIGALLFSLLLPRVLRDVEEEKALKAQMGDENDAEQPMKLNEKDEKGVVLGLIVGRTKMCWIKWGCLVFGVSTVLQGVALFVMAKTHDLYVAYAMFILFQTMFQVLVIIAKSQVAESIREKSEAFIFGMNTLTACIIHLLLTMAVTSRHGFHLPIRDQYVVYGVYGILLGVGFGCYDLPSKLAGKTRSWSVDVRNSFGRGAKVGGKDEKNVHDEEKEMETISASMPYSIPREH